MMSSHGGSTAGAWESHRATLSHGYAGGLHFHGGPPSSTVSSKSLSEKSHDGCWQQWALLNAEPESSTHPPSLHPPSDEPVSDLDSGCVQPSSVGNPLSYPLHLAFFLCVFTLHSGQRNTHHRMPPCPFLFFLSYNRMCHVSGIYLCMRYHRQFAGCPWCTQSLFVAAFCKHGICFIVSHCVKCCLCNQHF